MDITEFKTGFCLVDSIKISENTITYYITYYIILYIIILYNIFFRQNIPVAMKFAENET